MENYDWKYCSLGGVVRVKISSGEDIAHLDELDPKLWTVLSCPVKGLNLEEKTLELIDRDHDGQIHVQDVMTTAKWLTSVIKDNDSLLYGNDTLSLDNINTDCPDGKKIYDSALQVIKNIGKNEKSISYEDVSDTVKVFAGTAYNGDGIITALSSSDNKVKETIGYIGQCFGTVKDRSGEDGVDSAAIEKFYDAAAAYAQWHDSDKTAAFAFGDNTEAAFSAYSALKDKVADYFMRCKLIAFDEDAAAAVDVSVDRIAAISGENLSAKSDEIAAYPLARPGRKAVLILDSVNPAWKDAVERLCSLIPDLGSSIDEAEWAALGARFDAFCAWKAAKAGDEVEPLGIDTIHTILKDDKKAVLLDMIAKDLAVKEEADGLDRVCKLIWLYRDFATLLNNYVALSDFYNRSKSSPAIFEAGRLYIDQRCCKLCLRVSDMSAHADMAQLSGMFLIYCKCTRKNTGETMDIVAVMTAGNIYNLRPGKNGLFYDLQGNDWDAVITKIVDNPVSITQAFWTPYRKLSDFVKDKITKSVADKEAAIDSKLQEAVTNIETGEKKAAPFDIAKYAGIFAALGMAVGAIGMAISGILDGLKGLHWYQWIVGIIVLLLVISGPSCLIAWIKLRKRNLGPVLNANGWAINSDVLVNILFGRTLTLVAKYPKLNLEDPYRSDTPVWRKWITDIILGLIILFGILFMTGNLKFLGINRPEKQNEEIEAPAPQPAPEPVTVPEEQAM